MYLTSDYVGALCEVIKEKVVTETNSNNFNHTADHRCSDFKLLQ